MSAKQELQHPRIDIEMIGIDTTMYVLQVEKTPRHVRKELAKVIEGINGSLMA